MDVKKMYFEAIKSKITENYNEQIIQVKKVSEKLYEVINNGGVIQLFGVGHGQEFVNELNYRAGGLVPFHGINIKDLALNKVVSKKFIESSTIYYRPEYLAELLNLYKLDDRDAYILVSFYGNEPLLLELAKKVKMNGQLLISVVNKKSIKFKNMDSIANISDFTLDLFGDEPDIALNINGTNVGQVSSTIGNVLAQMITAEIYSLYKEKQKDAPILLSANLNGSDVHNNSLTDLYEGRVR